MKPISILWSDGVSESEVKTTVTAMRDLLRHMQTVALEQDICLAPITVRPLGNWIIQGVGGIGAYHSFRWYWQTSLDERSGQVSAATFIEIVRYEHWQQTDPHFDLALLHTDLRDDTADAAGAHPLAFACTEPDLVTVISTRHLAQVADPDLRLKCLRSLVIHNFGHLIGLPGGLPETNRNRPEKPTATKNAPARTCAMPCTMYEAQSLEELMGLATAEKDEKVILCDPCQEDLRSIVFRLHFSMN